MIPFFIARPPNYIQPSSFTTIRRSNRSTISLISWTAIASFVSSLIVSSYLPTRKRLNVFLISSHLCAIALLLKFRYARTCSIRALYSIKNELRQRRCATFKGDSLFSLSEDLIEDFLRLKKAALAFPYQKKENKSPSLAFTTQRQMVSGLYQIRGSCLQACASTTGDRHSDQGLGASNRFLKDLMIATARLLPDYAVAKRYLVQMLVTRHASSVPFLFVHQDGFNGWLAHYNLDYSPQGISGGRIQIIDYEKKMETIIVENLNSFLLDGYILDDQRFYHSATEIKIDPDSQAQRLVVIFRYYLSNVQTSHPQIKRAAFY